MPSIAAKYGDMCGLLGKKLDKEKLRDRLNALGIETDIVGEELKMEIAHNRPDLLSPEGVARALKGFLGIETGLPRYKLGRSKIVVEVDRSVKEIRPYIVAGVVKGVKLTDDIVASLMQVQEKLHTSLCRNRRRGSIGVYDLDKISSPIRFTTVLPEGQKFVPLEHNHKLTPKQILQEHPKGIEYAHMLQGLARYPLLIDSNAVVLSMPPIINSEDTRVSERTKNLFIDVTGTDEATVQRTLNVLVTGLAERGFNIFSVAIKYPTKKVSTPNLGPRKHKLGVSNANGCIGLKLKPAAMANLAKRMRYGVKGIGKNSVTLLAPPYRTDIMHEVDLVEDIAIGYGYDVLEPTIPAVVTIGKKLKIEKTSEKARMVLTGLGFSETMGYTLTNERKNSELMHAGGNLVELSNPVSEEFTVVRNSLLPSVLTSLYENRRHSTPQKLFEIGDVAVLNPATETGAKNVRRVSAAIVGREATFTYIKSVAEAVLRELGLEWKIEAAEHPGYLGGRVARLVSGKKLGAVGEIHPDVLAAFELEHPVAAFEIELG